MPNVIVQGPDGKTYGFPDGTTKDKAIDFFKKNNIGVTKSVTSSAPPTKDLGLAPEEKPGIMSSVGRGVEKSFGFDPQKMTEAYHKEGEWGQWKELSSQLIHTHMPAIAKGGLQIGEAAGAGAAIGSVVPGVGTAAGATIGAGAALVIQTEQAIMPQLKEGFGKMMEGFKSKNHDLAWEGGSQFVSSLGMLSSMAEKPGSKMKPSTVVDGSVKSAASTASKLGLNPDEATRMAHVTSTGTLGRVLNSKAVLERYVDSKGMQIQGKIGQAVKDVNKQIELHAQNLDKQIDQNVPAGVIDASAEATKIQNSFSSIVKTPERMNPRLVTMLDDASKTAPGNWSFAKARQFRSSIGRALGSMDGPQKAVASEVYKNLTEQLSGVAKKYKLDASWNQYNTLESQLHHYYGDLADKISDAKSGEQVFNALKTSEGLRKRFTENLSKYGLDQTEIEKYVKLANKNAISLGRKSIWRLAHGTAGGAAGTIAGALTFPSMGLPFMASLGAGALIGYMSTEIGNAFRAARLDPAVLEHIVEKTKLPSKIDLPKGSFPEATAEDVAPPSAKPGPEAPPAAPKPAPEKPKTPKEPPTPNATVPPTPPGATSPKPQEAPVVPLDEDLYREAKAIVGKRGHASASELQRELKIGYGNATNLIDRMEKEQFVGPLENNKRKVLSGTSVVEAKPGIVTKVPEGQHGTEPGVRPGTTRETPAARAAKARERVAAKRAAEGSTAAGGGSLQVSGGGVSEKVSEMAEAKARVTNPDLNVAEMTIKELEQRLKRLNPEELEGLKELRRRDSLDDETYKSGLSYQFLAEMEDRRVSERGVTSEGDE